MKKTSSLLRKGDGWAILRRFEPKRSSGLHALHGVDMHADLAGYMTAHPEEVAAMVPPAVLTGAPVAAFVGL